MQPIKTIIVAVDGSAPAEKAVDLATKIAGPTGARLLLLHVAEPIHLPRERYAEFVAQLEANQQREEQAILDEAMKRAEAYGVRAQTRSITGPVAESIADLAAEEQADLVVVGSRGQGAVARVFLGSVSDRLVHICKASVLVAR